MECWGNNLYGQLGDGTYTARSTASVPVSGLSGATAIAAGYLHTCAIVAGGAVECWGANSFGQLGDGTNTARSTAGVPVSSLSGATAIAAGSAHTCAIVAGGAVECWGDNSQDQLGNSTANLNGSTAVPVSGLSGATAIAAGAGRTCAIVADGAVECWGDNTVPRGDGTNTFSPTPVFVSGISGASAIAVGKGGICATIAGGAVECWDYGHVINGSTPVLVSSLSGATAIAAGSAHTCAVVAGGAVECWGNNSYGQLGIGTTTNSSTPMAVSGLSGATAIAAGDLHTCVIDARGAVECGGSNSDGQLGDGTTANRPTPVPVLNAGS